MNESLPGLKPARIRKDRLPATVPLSATRSAPGIGGPRPFRPCQPDVPLFPLALWNRLRGRSLRTYGARILYYHQSDFAFGLPALRQILAAYLRDSRGVRCDWRQTGSQQALFLPAHLLLKPHDRVLMEDPGYLGARSAWQSAGASIQPVAVDANGIHLPGRFPLLPSFTPRPHASFLPGLACRLPGGWR